MTAPDHIIYTPTQFAAAVGVSKKTVYNWLNSGRIRSALKDAEGRPLFTYGDVERAKAMQGG